MLQKLMRGTSTTTYEKSKLYIHGYLFKVNANQLRFLWSCYSRLLVLTDDLTSADS
jgi:hypothetical protein